MPLLLPKIYPITDTAISGLSHVEQVRRFVEGGATLVQLRDKNATPREFYEAAADVMAFAKPLGIRVIINDRVDIALAIGADGVHLGQDDLPVQYARKILGEGRIIGFSTHSVEQATAAVGLPLDYIAIGPIFGTMTKQNADPIVGLGTVAQVNQMIGEIPLVAIGGIKGVNYQSVIDAGASSVAIISDLLFDADRITETYRAMSGER